MLNVPIVSYHGRSLDLQSKIGSFFQYCCKQLPNLTSTETKENSYSRTLARGFRITSLFSLFSLPFNKSIPGEVFHHESILGNSIELHAFMLGFREDLILSTFYDSSERDTLSETLDDRNPFIYWKIFKLGKVL